MIFITQINPIFFSIAKQALPNDPVPSSLIILKSSKLLFFIAGLILILN